MESGGVGRARTLGCATAIFFSMTALATGVSASAKSPARPTCPFHTATPANGFKPHVFVDCNASDFIGQFDHMKLPAATRLLRTYIGKWILIRAKVDYLPTPRPADNPNESYLGLRIDNYTIGLTFFGDVWKQRVARLKVDDQITVAGQIDNVNIQGVETDDLSLTNTEIIDSGVKH